MNSRSPSTATFDSSYQEAFLGLWRTYDRLRVIEEQFFDRFGLSPQQYNALRVLRASHPKTIPTLALAGSLVSRAADITRLLDKLDAAGLTVRERLPENRRTVRIGITAAGQALLDRIDAGLGELHAQQLGHLSSEQLAELVALLRAARAPHEPPESKWR